MFNPAISCVLGVVVKMLRVLHKKFESNGMHQSFSIVATFTTRTWFPFNNNKKKCMVSIITVFCSILFILYQDAYILRRFISITTRRWRWNCWGDVTQHKILSRLVHVFHLLTKQCNIICTIQCRLVATKFLCQEC